MAKYGELDLDLLKEQLKIKQEMLEKTQAQLAEYQSLFRRIIDGVAGKLADNLSKTNALTVLENQLNIGIREIQEKIDKLDWFVAQVSQYFTDSLQVLNLAIQGATQLSQVLVDSAGNYSTDGIDMSWSAKMKAQKIQTVSKSDYRTPQEQAIDKAVKDMKLSGAAEIYYRGKLKEKLQGKPRSEWKKIISNFNKDLKTDKGDNLLDVFNMTRAELEEKYGGKIQAYERFLTTGRSDASIATMSQDALQLIMARYDQVKNDHRGLSPTELAKVDPAFKKKIDGMNQEEIEKEFPELKNAISQAHVKPFGNFGMSETEWANHRYVTDRYFLMDSQKLLSWRDPNYMTKFNHYILEEGINPITLEPATAEEIQTAEWYNHIHPITETLSWGTALYSAYVGYNQYYNKPYTTIPEAFGKGKDWIKGKIPSVGSQPVVGPQLPSKNLDSRLPKINDGGLDNPIVDEISTVGRWMSREEYTKMIDSGKVQMSPNGNTTYVATPSNIEAFPAAKPGSVFTEFDVNSQSLYPAGKEGWGQIPGPGSLIDRLNQKKGLPAITEMPDARNINIKGEK